jgi:hypothetical protein
MKSFLHRRVAAGLLALGVITAGAVPFADAANNYATNVATARLQVVADLISGKTIAAATGTATSGSLVIGTSALSGATGVLVTIPLSATCCTVSGKVLTVSGTPLSANPSASGTAALAEFRNSSGVVIDSGLTIGTSSADIIVNTTTVATGVPFTVNSATITHP